ncbi:endosomal/lysosomal proton channel TMEM175-like [Glandiceps talaboti]
MAMEQRYMSSERTRGYSDAVYAIVITILIVPISDQVSDFDDSKSVLQNVWDQALSIGIYALAALFIYSEWEEHVWTFQSIARVGDALLLCNILMLLPITFLPYTITVLSEHIEDPFAIFLFSVCVLIISVMELLVILVGYHVSGIGSDDAGEYKSTKHLRGVLMFKDCLKMILSVLAAAICTVSVYVSWAILILLVFHDWLAALLIGIYNSTLTDAIFSIVATLIVLDLSSSSVPNNDALKADNTTLKAVLGESQHEYLSYLSSFITVGLMWLNHHTVFHYATVITRSMQACNKYSLMFVGLFPYCFKLTAVYAEDSDDRDENVVVQISCVVIFFASMFQLLLYILACRHSSKHLDDSYKGLAHTFIILKLLVYPATTLAVFSVCFKSTTVNADIINGVKYKHAASEVTETRSEMKGTAEHSDDNNTCDMNNQNFEDFNTMETNIT